MDKKPEQIGIIGTGLIGAGWAAFYAAKGFGVTLYDENATARRNGQKRALQYLAFLKDHCLLSAADHDLAVAGLKVSDDLEQALQGAQLVQESVSERYDIKKDVFRRIDRATPPEVILASSSSGLLISELQTVMKHPGRSLIAHPFNPPHLIPLVELVPGKRTQPQTISWAKTFFAELGKIPVILNKEVPGHIANRLQAAVWREAIDLVLKGVASVTDVDRALSAGPGLRWALWGPHMIFHLAGGEAGIKHFIDHIGTSWKDIWEDMANWTSIPHQAADALQTGLDEQMADRTPEEMGRWRDEKIVRLRKIIYRE